MCGRTCARRKNAADWRADADFSGIHPFMSTWRPIPPPRFWQRWLPEWAHGPAVLLFKATLVGAILATALAAFYLLLALRYNLDEVARMPGEPLFFDRDGRRLASPGGSGRILIGRKDIPDFLVKALLAREDARFFDHAGVDIRGLGRASARNLKDMEFTQGASTLTMQLARNTYDIRAKSLHRKFLEIALTLRIEARFSKDEILTHYLNRIYFGAGAHGIEQAALTYFGKPARQLDEGECAMIVGVIRGPSVFSPFRSMPAAIEQRDQTLNRMVAMGLIDTKRRDAIMEQPIKVAARDAREDQLSYAFRTITQELNGILDSHDIRSSGLEVHTTLSAAWQDRLERDLNQTLRKIEKEKAWRHPTPTTHRVGENPAYLQCAAVTLDTRTGGVMALIGGRDYLHSGYDRTAALRDLGQAFEPFVAAAAAERGGLVLPGRPIQTGRQVGPKEVQRIAKRCGLKSLGDSLNESEDVFRGAVSATAMEMAVGLATLGNKGQRPRPHCISQIKDGAGKVLFSRTHDLTQVITPAAAHEAASVLKRSGKIRGFTGATASERDAWALRLGPTGSTVIWVGFDKPTVITTDARLKALVEEFISRLAS